MNSSPVPVVVVPEESDLSFEGPMLKMLLADDLKERSESVLRHSLSLMSQLMPCELVHLHVLELSLWSSIVNADARGV